jgi:hypothetical protein
MDMSLIEGESTRPASFLSGFIGFVDDEMPVEGFKGSFVPGKRCFNGSSI